MADGARIAIRCFQEPVTGPVPPDADSAGLFCSGIAGKPHHFNQAVMVTVAANVQRPILAQFACRALVGHHDGLRIALLLPRRALEQVIQSSDAVTVTAG